MSITIDFNYKTSCYKD